MIVRNGAEFIKPVIEAVMPYVKRIKVGIDGRCTDGTMQILSDMGVEWTWFAINSPKKDLVDLRNLLLEKVQEKYILVLDSDELHPDCSFFSEVKDADVYTLQCHAPWTKTMGHKASARAKIPRIFKNDGRRWTGHFGREQLHKPRDVVVDIPYRYIHLTHLKKDNWREEMNQRRVADGKSLYKLPDSVIKELNKII